MSKYVVSILCLLLYSSVIFSQNNLFKQNQDNSKVYNRYQVVLNELDNEILEQRRLVDKFVKENETERSFVKDSVVFVELIGVNSKGDPIYYETSNYGGAKAANLDRSQKETTFCYRGEEMVIGMFDATVASGIHQEFAEKKNIIVKSAVPNKANNLNDRRKYQLAQQHSTHVGGTLIASGIEIEAQGVVPEAIVWSYDWNRDFRDMYYASLEGLLISNHSYGTNVIGKLGQININSKLVGAYERKAAEFDYLAYENEYYQSIVAAGNNQEFSKVIRPDGNGFGNIVGIAVAKNSIVVGAAEDVRGYNEIKDLKLASFSSYGPALDFRIKPDIIAKGVTVYSSINDLETINSEGVRDDLYQLKSGTSMATPIVTGAVTIWQQWAQKHFGDLMWSSSIRALLVQSAKLNEEMFQGKKSSFQNSEFAPHPAYGWGILDIKKGIDLLKEIASGETYLIEDRIRNKSERVYVFDNSKQGNSLMLTLAWTDPPGSYDYNLIYGGIVSKALVHDLDVRVRVKDNVYLPWALHKDMDSPIAILKDNDVDNLERITISDLPRGLVEVKITHKELLNVSQSFSLILSSKERLKFISVNKSDEDIFKKVDNSSFDREEDSIIFWPNPATDTLNILHDNELVIYSIELFNNHGKRIRKFDRFVGNMLNISDLDSGLYIIKSQTNKGNYEFKLIKK